MNVNGVPIKIDMPMSQYGTLELGHRLYNVHVRNIHTSILKSYPPQYRFTVEFVGTEAVQEEPVWEDSYESP